jgi:hypothetical protein
LTRQRPSNIIFGTFWAPPILPRWNPSSILVENDLEYTMKNSKTRLAVFLLSTLCLLTSAYAQITPSSDAYTNSADPTTNYGSNVLLYVDGAKETTYIQFDLASIPSGASVSHATLKLYVNAVTTAGSFNVDYVNGTWVEGTITQNMAPALGSTVASNVSITKEDKNQYILIDITPALQAWLNGSQANDGIALVANGSFNASFDSKESKTTSHPAELDVVFAGGGTITGVLTGSASGLTGGGTSGTLDLSLTMACSAKQVLQWNGSAWACSNAGTGTITGVTAGTDLTGGGTSGNVTLNLNTAATDSRYAQLAANNTFTGTQTVNNTMIMSGTNTNGVLQVTNTVTSGSGPAIVAMVDSSGAAGIQGIVAATSGTTAGIYGQTSSPDGRGVHGSGGKGVVGTSTIGPLVGVYGVANAGSKTGGLEGFETAVWGDSADYTGVLGTSDNATAGLFYNESTVEAEATLIAENFSTTKSNLVFETQGVDFDGICTIDVKGNLACTGSKSAVVPVDGGTRKVALYAVEAPENWFEDAGSAQLSHGSARIDLDPTFAQTVDTAIEYHVFLTPKGDCKGLYVSNESAASFEVHELGGGTSSIAFDYRVMAKRNSYENVRLADFTERYKALEVQREKRRLRSSAQRPARP